MRNTKSICASTDHKRYTAATTKIDQMGDHVALLTVAEQKKREKLSNATMGIRGDEKQNGAAAIGEHTSERKDRTEPPSPFSLVEANVARDAEEAGGANHDTNGREGMSPLDIGDANHDNHSSRTQEGGCPLVDDRSPLEEPLLSPHASLPTPSSNTGPILAALSRPLLHASNRFGGRKLVLLATVFLSVFATEFVDDEIAAHRHIPASDSTRGGGGEPNPMPEPPFVQRARRVAACAAHLSPRANFDDVHSAQGHSAQGLAVEWFLFGPGRLIPPPKDLDGCKWDTEFGSLYSLLVLRGALNVAVPSWHSSAVVTGGLADVCHKWHCVECSDDNKRITKLHLGDANLSGTIPNEVSGLRFLQRLELYRNPGINGTAPAALGQMTELRYLYLHSTSLAGEIPPALAKLDHLQELFVERTNFFGSMPSQICNLRSAGNLMLLQADCAGKKPRMVCPHPKCCSSCVLNNHTMGLHAGTKSSEKQATPH